MQPLSSTPAQSNAYLALREAKIARNNARLHELGLLASSMSPIPPSKHTNKRQRTSLNIDSYGIHAVTERRKSERLRRSAMNHERLERATPSMMKSTESDPSGAVVAQALSPPTAKHRIVSSALNSFSMSPVTSRTSVASTSSAREIHLNVPTLLFGSSGSASDVGLLGRPMPLAGKAFVMEESARLASNLNPYPRVSFNKYSGAQEWGNNVLFLWINFGAPNSPVVNQFFDNGRKVNWFGGSRMHNTTPVISKLKQIGALAAKGGDDSNGSVVLWARKYCCLKKGFDPYVCLGRLALVSYDPFASPIVFIWKLLDYETLVTNQSPDVKGAIQSLSMLCSAY